MHSVPAAERFQIGLFGRRNTGKSSLLNSLTGQPLAVVSPMPGTTTDPVRKAIEIHPLGPCLLIDTPGLDDSGDLGRERVRQALTILRRIDLALLVVEPYDLPGAMEMDLAASLRAAGAAVLFVVNKCDLHDGAPVASSLEARGWPTVVVSAFADKGMDALKARVIESAPMETPAPPLIGDLLFPSASVVLVTPVDAGMPRGRLILPEVQVLREILDVRATAHVAQPGELPALLRALAGPPDLVVTDSQAFPSVVSAVPPEVPLTSFSLLFARQRGDLERYTAGVEAVGALTDGDRVLVAEACTHHPQPSDIGRVKIPAWLRKHTGRALRFESTGGGAFPDDLSPYRLVVHCGGCMVNRREVRYRLARAAAHGVPMTNYGVLIAHLHGVLERAVRPLRRPLQTSETRPQGTAYTIQGGTEHVQAHSHR